MNKVFILGAGFSKEINNDYPTLKELTNSVYKSFENKYEKNPIFQHYQSLPSECRMDVEKLLSFLSIDWPWKDEITKHLDLALYKALEIQIMDVIGDISNKHIANEYISFIRLASDQGNSIITLNYDSLVEEIANKHGLQDPCEYCGYEIIIEDNLYPYTVLESKQNIALFDIEPKNIGQREVNQQIRINKNYLVNTEAEEIDEQFEALIGKRWHTVKPSSFKAKVIRSRVSRINPNIIKLHGSIANEYTDCKTEAFIIPPTLDKSIYYSSQKIRNAWISSLEILKKAEEINIIGFSFPYTDLSMVYLIQTALQENDNVKFNVLNIEKTKTVKSRYQEIVDLGKINIDFQYCGIKKPLKKYTEDSI
jgi:hypothetical protein